MALNSDRMGGGGSRGGSGAHKLYIESPLTIFEDVAVGAFNYSIVKQHFRLAHDLMRDIGPKKPTSLLQSIIHDKLFLYNANLTGRS